MRRRRRQPIDDAQFSLDRFRQAQAKPAQGHEETIVPSMPDLDILEAAEAQLDGKPNPTSRIKETEPEAQGPRSFRMPSSSKSATTPLPKSTMTYHDLATLYPHAPVPLYEGEMVLHNSTLLDITGCGVLMDWVSDGHGSIVEMKRLMGRPTEFKTALAMLNEFIEGDVRGQIIRITDTRLLLLPQGCRGLKGTDMEGFAVSPDDLTDVYS